MTPTHLIIHEHELTLKGRNRPWFVDKLKAGVRHAFRGLPVGEPVEYGGRLIAPIAGPIEFDEVRRRTAHLFGAAFMMAAVEAEADIEKITQKGIAMVRNAQTMGAKSFAIQCKRGDKRFPMNSQQIAGEVGGRVKEATGLEVDLENPDVTVSVEIVNGKAYVGTERFDAPGGLPLGSSGRFLVMMSGGIDSPVAAYEIMKRGGVCDFIHFHSAPFTSRASVEKVEEIVRVLEQYEGPSKLELVPFADIQKEIMMKTPDEFRILLYRRAMVRIAEATAHRLGAQAIVTGENLGQVASQTIENMTVVEDAATIPILRPLLTWNKQDIINKARAVGTYEISIRPHEDCCTLFMPKNPATRAKIEQIRNAEQYLQYTNKTQ